MTYCSLVEHMQSQMDRTEYNRLKDMIGAEWRPIINEYIPVYTLA